MFVKALVGKLDKNVTEVAKLSSKHCVIQCDRDPHAGHRMCVYLTDTSRNGTKLDGFPMRNICIYIYINRSISTKTSVFPNMMYIFFSKAVEK